MPIHEMVPDHMGDFNRDSYMEGAIDIGTGESPDFDADEKQIREEREEEMRKEREGNKESNPTQDSDNGEGDMRPQK